MNAWMHLRAQQAGSVPLCAHAEHGFYKSTLPRVQIRKYKVIKTPLSVYKSTAGREKYRSVFLVALLLC